jgi:branched-chain amino acid transport system permease protein
VNRLTLATLESARCASGLLAFAVLFPLLAAAGLAAWIALAVAFFVAAALGFWLCGRWLYAAGGAVLPLLVYAPFYFPAFQMNQILSLGLIAIGLYVLTGLAGQISVAHGSFVGIGAYVTAILMTNHGWNFWATAPLAALAGALLGMLIAIPSARLAGIYQVMTTLALATSFPILIKHYSGFTGGVMGISVETRTAPSWVSSIRSLSTDQYGYFTVLVLAVICVALTIRITRGHPGRAMRAMRDNEIAARASGVNIARTKLLAFVLSGFFAGLGGATYAVTVGIVSPDSFGLFYSIQFLVIIVVGGLRSIAGCFLGAAFIWELGLKTGEITVPGIHFTITNEVVYGVILIVVLVLMPLGIFGLLQRGAASTWINRVLRHPISDGHSTGGGRKPAAAETADLTSDAAVRPV